MYLIGSLRNPTVPQLGNKLRAIGWEAFDDWYGAGHEADDEWQRYENLRGRDYKAALHGYAARHVFAFDQFHLNRVDAATLILPAGKSGHLELGYAAGLGKRTYILFDSVPERYDVMYNFATDVFFSQDEFLEAVA